MKLILKLLSTISIIGATAANATSCSLNSSKKFSDMYILGDSLSDNGTLTNVLTQLLNEQGLKQLFSFIKTKLPDYNPPVFTTTNNVDENMNNFSFDPYYYGNGSSFTNSDPTLVMLAKKLGFNPTPALAQQNINFGITNFSINQLIGTDYAVGGAVALYQGGDVSIIDLLKKFFSGGGSAFSLLTILGPLLKNVDIYQQAKTMVAQHNDISTSLIAMEIGGNDLMNVASILDDKNSDAPFDKAEAYIKKAAANVSKTFTFLKDSGAKNVIFLNAPDVTQIPAFSSFDKSDDLTELVKEYNDIVKNAINDINKKNNLNYHLFDLYNQFFTMRTHFRDKGVDVSDPCIQESTTPEYDATTNTIYETANYTNKDKTSFDDFLFWDSIHPTRIGHQYCADIIYNNLMNNK